MSAPNSARIALRECPWNVCIERCMPCAGRRQTRTPWGVITTTRWAYWAVVPGAQRIRMLGGSTRASADTQRHSSCTDVCRGHTRVGWCMPEYGHDMGSYGGASGRPGERNGHQADTLWLVHGSTRHHHCRSRTPGTRLGADAHQSSGAPLHTHGAWRAYRERTALHQSAYLASGSAHRLGSCQPCGTCPPAMVHRDQSQPAAPLALPPRSSTPPDACDHRSPVDTHSGRVVCAASHRSE
jgi:hypothetical protein